MADKADRDFDLAMATLANDQSYLADHKNRRWDMVKWAVSVNLAFATATAFKIGAVGILVFLFVCDRDGDFAREHFHYWSSQ